MASRWQYRLVLAKSVNPRVPVKDYCFWVGPILYYVILPLNSRLGKVRSMARSCSSLPLVFARKHLQN